MAAHASIVVLRCQSQCPPRSSTNRFLVLLNTDSPNIGTANMDSISWFWTTFMVVVASAIVYYLIQQFSCFTEMKHKLPPGPKGLPILGHLHLLGKNPPQDLKTFLQKNMVQLCVCASDLFQQLLSPPLKQLSSS
ncbi:hypothetical protein Leryth_015132 [Lithospermum erythrorhizon]|nr:hypothetical protein Leryth_015132 [Lithospermum erythrorhizon]